jgi:hypothetical protein
MVEKAGARMGKMSLLSTTLFGMNNPINKAPTIDKRMMHNVMLTSSVTQNVSLAFTITPLNHFLHLAFDVFVGPPGGLQVSIQKTSKRNKSNKAQHTYHEPHGNGS